MDKILFLSEFTKVAINIHEQMKTLFDATFLGFDLNKARAFIKEEKPVLAVAYVKDLPYESEHALHLLLGAEEIPFILIGSKNECHDFFNQGNIKKYIITPIAIKDMLPQIESTVDMIECRLSKKEMERKKAEEAKAKRTEQEKQGAIEKKQENINQKNCLIIVLLCFHRIQNVFL